MVFFVPWWSNALVDLRVCTFSPLVRLHAQLGWQQIKVLRPSHIVRPPTHDTLTTTQKHTGPSTSQSCSQGTRMHVHIQWRRRTTVGRKHIRFKKRRKKENKKKKKRHVATLRHGDPHAGLASQIVGATHSSPTYQYTAK